MRQHIPPNRWYLSTKLYVVTPQWLKSWLWEQLYREQYIYRLWNVLFYHITHRLVIGKCSVVDSEIFIRFIVAMLSAGCPRNRGLFPGKGKKLVCSRKRPASLQWVLKAYFPEVKRLGRNADNCLSSRTHAKKQWGYTFTPTYTFVAVIWTTYPLFVICVHWTYVTGKPAVLHCGNQQSVLCRPTYLFE